MTEKETFLSDAELQFALNPADETISEGHKRVLIHRLKKKYLKAWETVLLLDEMLRNEIFDKTMIPWKFGYSWHIERLKDVKMSKKHEKVMRKDSSEII